MTYKNKEDQKKCQRRWYKNNKKKAKKWIAERKERIRKWFLEYKKTLKCELCPESHPSCLDFHHKKEETKEFNISIAATDGWSIKTIKEEIKKCDVLCANCHRKHHWGKKNNHKPVA